MTTTTMTIATMTTTMMMIATMTTTRTKTAASHLQGKHPNNNNNKRAQKTSISMYLQNKMTTRTILTLQTATRNPLHSPFHNAVSGCNRRGTRATKRVAKEAAGPIAEEPEIWL